jgi:hypothetical protein
MYALLANIDEALANKKGVITGLHIFLKIEVSLMVFIRNCTLNLSKRLKKVIKTTI